MSSTSGGTRPIRAASGRRTTLEDYVTGDPDWEVILDLDALAEAEGEDWVWKGAACLRPDYRLCALYLSRGGADAVVIREFDVEDKAFVEDGFVVSEAKSQLSWMDEDAVYIETDFGGGLANRFGLSPAPPASGGAASPSPTPPKSSRGEQSDVAAGVLPLVGWRCPLRHRRALTDVLHLDELPRDRCRRTQAHRHTRRCEFSRRVQGPDAGGTQVRLDRGRGRPIRKAL